MISKEEQKLLNYDQVVVDSIGTEYHVVGVSGDDLTPENTQRKMYYFMVSSGRKVKLMEPLSWPAISSYFTIVPKSWLSKDGWLYRPGVCGQV